MITLLLAAAFRIESVTMPTYPYSDPDPVPTAEPQRYPYFRYDGQSAVSRPQAWEAVKLSNGRIEVTAIPAIGGKVWGAKDLVTGRDFIYANDAVKFRDIALRGPWCSGGIEFNFGITGHAPWTVSPVDWTVRTNGDGSASYFFGGYEFVTRTWWQVEVILRDGEDFFTTRMTWHNSGGQPCTRYQWSTSAVTARGNPRMVYPGANQINHDGTAYPWPRDDRGVDRSRYANDGDLEAVSWHVMNGDNRFFGIWYPDWKTGMWHRNAAEDKFGRKIFMWSQARSGGIWEDLLTDRAGQYIELQSGRGMQQQVGGCEKTPFKFQTLVPGATDTFEEQWGVARDTKPFDEAGAFPCGEIARPLVFPRDYDTNGVYALYRDGEQKMRYGQDVAGAAKLLERALAKDPCFVPALGELAAFELRRGNVAKAERLAEKALAVDTYDGPANFVSGEIALDAGRLERARERFGVAALDAALRPAALVRLGMVAVREKDYALAAGLAGKALACSAYDPEAHQLAAVAARLAGDRVSAMKAVKDGFVRTPVHYGLKYENLLLGASEPLTRCELPGPTLVETGLWYAKAGLADEAKRIWAMAPRSPVAKLLSGDLKGAAALPVDLVFPHGRETIAALERAMGESPSWKFKYYLAIALAPFGETVRSDALLEACGNEPDAAVFYLCRAARRTGADALADLKRAAALDDSWRVGCALAKTYLKDKRPDEAFAAADAYRRRYPGMQQLDAAAVTALIEAKRFKEALAILERINVLPSEFNKAVPAQWNRCHRALAEAALASGDKATAKKHVEAALSFPENLGDGRPVKPLSVLDDWPAELRELVIGTSSAAAGHPGFVVDVCADLTHVSGTETLVEVPGVFAVTVRPAGKDPALLAYDRDRGNYLNFPLADGSVPVVEAVLADGTRAGMPLGALSRHGTNDTIKLSYARTHWRLGLNGRIDEDFLRAPLPSVKEQDLVRRSPRVHGVKFTPLAPGDPFGRETASIPLDRSIQYFTGRGYNTWVGDVAMIAFKGRFHVFYLEDRRHHASKGGAGGHQFLHLSSSDLVRWDIHPTVTFIDEFWQTFGTGTPFVKDGKLCLSYGLHTTRLAPREKTSEPKMLADFAKTGAITAVPFGADGLLPLGATWAESEDGIRFTPSRQVFHTTQNPAVETLPDGTFRLWTGYGGDTGADGAWASADFLTWKPTGEKNVLKGDCPCPFSWNDFDYLLQGDRWAWRRTNAVWKVEATETFYDGLSVPMVAAWGARNERRILGGWLAHPVGFGGWLALRELVQRADGTLGTKWVPETPIPAPVATYARNGGEALEVTFVAERGDGRLTLRVDPVARTAAFAERTGKDAQEKILQRVGDVRGLARAYAVRLVACYDRKADATVFDAEIAGDRTLIAARRGRWTARAARCAGEATRIDCGRQLFVDDALTGESRGVERHWNRPVKRRDPLVWPSGGAGAAARGKGRAPAGLTCATDGGLWWDPKLRRYRLWYQADWCGDACYAESADGETWTYPELGAVKGTNRLFAEDDLDSWCVVPDYAAADPYAKWCLYVSAPGGITRDRLWTSRDGKAFEPCGTGGWSGDRSTVYYDPFRTNWVFSLRDYRKEGRVRRYFAAKDFASARWSWPKMWGHRDPASHEKEPRPDEWLVATNRPNWALYNFDAVAYESVMFGVMEVLYNTPGDNEDCMKTGLPKQTGLHFCFSRDGRTYVPRDEPDLAPEGWGSGAWDTGYLSPVAGICTVGEEEIRIHYSGLRGDGRITATDRWEDNGMYVNGAIGCAVLRRDGFAGMVADGNGELVTKPVTFSGKHLFVNADCRFGELRVEVLGDDGEALPGFTAADCVPFAGESACKREITWKGGTLASFADRPVRFRFKIGCGTLYAFWVSPSSRGESRGYVAAGSPAYPGLRDL